jgi:hypothetical protein
MYGPFEQRCNGPTAEFFQMLNRIQYVWMPHSNGLYSPPDTPEPSLLDLFGSTTSDSSMALLVESVARAHMDDDSIETETDSVHVGSDGTVTSMHVGPDGTINSISRMFSSYTNCLPVSCKNRFWTGMGECRSKYAAASSANGLGFSPAGAESSDAYGSAPNTGYGDRLPAQCSAYVQPFTWAYYAKGVSSKLWKQAKGSDPADSIFGIGSALRNWMPDTGAYSHFTPCLLDLKEVEEGLDLGLEVADGHIAKCTAWGIVEINIDQASIHTCYQARTGHLCGCFTTSFC